MNREAKGDEWWLKDVELEKGVTKAGADRGNHHGGDHGMNSKGEHGRKPQQDHQDVGPRHSR